MPEERLVEAIEDGQIVKVSELYAKREGLLIIKKAEMQINQSGKAPSFYDNDEKPERNKPITEYFKKKPDWREQQVISELVENFNWKIRSGRRKKGLTRRQLSRIINEPDENLQILETGRLPSFDFVLINKVQKALDINLRKDKKDFTQTHQEIISQIQDNKREIQDKNQTTKPKDESHELADAGIEILEEEI